MPNRQTWTLLGHVRRAIGAYTLILEALPSFRCRIFSDGLVRGVQVPKALEVDESTNGQTNVLLAGQGLVIRLSESPTTGYQWMIESFGVLQLLGSDYESAGSGLGAGGTRYFRFAAVTPSRSDILLCLRRSWEVRSAATRDFTLTVISG
jgi:predicted secreted protein